MSTDEKYLLSLKAIKKDKPIPWEYFLDQVSSFYPTKPENIFLLLYKKKYIYCKGYESSIDKIKLDMSFGYSPTLNHIYFRLTKLGLDTITSLQDKELFKHNGKQLKLDI